MAAEQGPQTGPLSQRHHRDQPAPGHEIRVVKGCRNPQRIMRQSHLASALLNWPAGASDTPIVPVQGALSGLPHCARTSIARWIQAQQAAKDARAEFSSVARDNIYG